MESKMMTKDELLNQLEISKAILNQEMVDYLNSIINLEFSVVRDGIISDEQRTLMTNLEVYRQIAKYNILERAFNLLKGTGEEIALKSRFNVLQYTILTDKNIDVFDYYYRTRDKIGKIVLRKITNDPVVNTQKLEYFTKKLYRLRIEKNILKGRRKYDDECRELEINPIPTDISDDMKHDLFVRINCEIVNARNIINKLNNGLTDDETRRVELSNNFFNQLAEDYGLSGECLTDDKILVKKLPGLTIEQDVKQII